MVVVSLQRGVSGDEMRQSRPQGDLCKVVSYLCQYVSFAFRLHVSDELPAESFAWHVTCNPVDASLEEIPMQCDHPPVLRIFPFLSLRGDYDCRGTGFGTAYWS